jgi:hypothetical protein
VRELALVLVLIASATADSAIIRGVPSCGYWIQDREPGGRSSYFNAMWLVGYLSGAAVHSEKDILRSTDSESIAVWMDRYCNANPSKSVADGGEALFDELVRYGLTDRPSPAAAALAPVAPEPPAPAPSEPAMASPALGKAPKETPAEPSSRRSAESPGPVRTAPTDQQGAAATSPAPKSTEPLARDTSAPVTASSGPAKAPVEAPAEPSHPQRVESQAPVRNALTYSPRALTLANTLPLVNSKYQFKAEQFAKANGCIGPAATMNIKTATSETFSLSCSNGAALSIRCDPDCRDLQ